MFSERARAKINLTLHVGAPIDEPSSPYHGYHPLDSLVAFADLGDDLSCDRAETTSLTISGPFSTGLEADAENLILRAYQAVSNHTDLPALRFHLVKNLPIASGIGGGSADAAATLRLLRKYAELSDEIWFEIALSLGADVPVCLASKTSRMGGIGEELEPVEEAGTVHGVLINPGKAVSTRDIYKAFDAAEPEALDCRSLDSGDLISLAARGRNDLEPIAMTILPEIGAVLRELAGQNGCHLARMSGSGATCFGLFSNKGHASAARARIANKFPDWWVQATVIGEA